MVQQYLPSGDYTSSILDLSANLPSSQPISISSTSRRQRQMVRDSKPGKIGKPGSKRYQRYLNKSFLQEQQWDLKKEDFEVFQFSCSPFSLLFEESNKRKWAPFIDITEEEQNQLLSRLREAFSEDEKYDEFGDFVFLSSQTLEAKDFEEPEEEKTPSPPAEIHFRKVEKKIRKFIRKNSDLQIIQSLDQEIVEYIQLSTYQPKKFTFSESLHRMICHGICQFYTLSSKSEDCTSGNRVVVVRKPKKGISFPSMTLTKFLQTM